MTKDLITDPVGSTESPVGEVAVDQGQSADSGDSSESSGVAQASATPEVQPSDDLSADQSSVVQAPVRRWWRWLFLVVLLLGASGGWWWYQQGVWLTHKKEPAEPVAPVQEPVTVPNPEVERLLAENEQLRAAQTSAQNRIQLLQSQLQQLNSKLQSIHNTDANYAQAQDFNRLLNLATVALQVDGDPEKAFNYLKVLYNGLQTQSSPIFSTLTQAVAHDMAQLEQLPRQDINALYLALDQLLQDLHHLPFYSPVRPSDMAGQPLVLQHEQAPSALPEHVSWWEKALDWLHDKAKRTWYAIEHELASLVKVERLTNMQAATLSVEQVQALRQSMQQHVRLAQEGLLKRQQYIWESNLSQLQQQFAQYVNAQSQQVAPYTEAIAQWRSLSVAQPMPTLNASRTALNQLLDGLRRTH